jgi:hypothetical protein
MMSAASLMMAGLEQTKVHPLSEDLISGQGEPQDASFAKSFAESVGMPASSQEKNAADDLETALPGLQGSTPAKKLEEVADKSGGAKENPTAAQVVPVHSELNGAVAGKIVQPQATTTLTASPEKITASGSGTTKVEVPAQAEAVADDVSPGYSVLPHATPVPGATEECPVPRGSIAGGDQPLAPSVLSGDSPVVQRGTEAEEKGTEGVSLKKPVKAQESSATQKTVQKTVGKTVDVIAVQHKPVTGISMESAIPVVEQVVAPMVAQPGEISKTADTSGKVGLPAPKPGTGISLVAIDGQARQDIVSGAKPSGAKLGATDTAITVTMGSDPVATPKTDMSSQQVPAVATVGGSDGENKPQAAREPGAALLHSLGIVPTAGVFGNTPGEVAPTKMVVVGDAGPRTAGQPAGSTGQDGAGVVAPSMDGAPRIVAATPTSLEVGIQNGTQGWLRVRAEMTDGGVVNASVSTTSPAGLEMLHRELPALNAYLQEEKVAVNAVIIHTPPVGMDARSSSDMGGGGGQTPQRSDEGGGQDQNLRKAALNGSNETMTYHSLLGADEDGSLPIAAYANGGNWLSVRA